MNGKIIELSPIKLMEIIENYPIAYCAVSPIEWHGNHLPLGTDALRAEWLMNQVSEEVGGILFPTEYCGTDGLLQVEGEKLWYLELVVGEKLIGNFLVEEGVFYNRILSLVNNVKRNPFKILVLCTGHLSPQQIKIMKKIKKECSNKNFTIILWHSEKVSFPKQYTTEDYLHAGVEETSEMLYINEKIVDISKLGKTKEEAMLGLTDEIIKGINKDMGYKRLQIEKTYLAEKIKEVLKNINKK